MPTLPPQYTNSLSLELSEDTVQDTIDKMEHSEVSNVYMESEEQSTAVFVSRDPAVIMVLKALFEETGDLSAFFKTSEN